MCEACRWRRIRILGYRIDNFQIFPYYVGDEIRDLLVVFHWLRWGSMNLAILLGWLGRGVMFLIIPTGFCP